MLQRSRNHLKARPVKLTNCIFMLLGHQLRILYGSAAMWACVFFGIPFLSCYAQQLYARCGIICYEDAIFSMMRIDWSRLSQRSSRCLRRSLNRDTTFVLYWYAA